MTIGEVGFDWQPTELEQFSSGMRGQDARFESDTRVRADERRFAKDLRRAERLGLDLGLEDLPVVTPSTRSPVTEGIESWDVDVP